MELDLKKQFEKRKIEDKTLTDYASFLEKKIEAIHRVASEFHSIPKASVSDALYGIILISES